MTRRDYLSQADRSLDYLVIFIPNEQVYSVVNEWMPGVIDECLPKRLILCGPWTLYAVLRIIYQAWQNYHYSRAVGEIVHTIHAFLQEYRRFQERFVELGERLSKATEKYQEIATTSSRRLESKIQEVEAYRKGQPMSDPDLESVAERVEVQG